MDLLGGDGDRIGEAGRLAGEGEREGVPLLLFLLHECDDVVVMRITYTNRSKVPSRWMRFCDTTHTYNLFLIT